MPNVIKKNPWSILLLCGLLLLALLLVGCGGASSSGSANTAAMPAHVPHNAASSSGQQKTSAAGAQQYLIKSLNVSMNVQDTRKVASDLQNWIATTDPHATAGGIDYEQVGDNLYNVSMTFSVEATLYPQIESYLANYPAQHQGRLVSLQETVQDVSNDYIDTQSRLKNLRGEQERLLTLLSHAQALTDILDIEQKLTDVEGQIEQIEAHLNQLNGQVSFYTIAISIQPAQTAVTPPPASWSPLAVWQGALSAAAAFGQVLLTFFIWLLVFSVYIVPLALIIWFVRRWRRLRSQRIIPPIATPPPSQVAS